MKLRLITITSFILLIYTNINAQINYGGTPFSFNQAPLKSIPIFKTPKFDYQQMIREDEENKRGAKPYRFGKTFQVNINPENSGLWTTLPSGEKIWRLQIHSDNAYAIGLFFKQFQINKGVRFFAYSTDKSILKGAFTEKNNKTSKFFSMLPIAGEDIIIELNVPKDIDYGTFELSGIIHDYKNAFGKSTKSSGSCNVNVNCPEGADWQNEKRAVAKYTFVSDDGGTYMCSGALINNTRNDATPYFLTAYHCISSQTEAQSAVFIFNYESELCSGTTGPTDQTISAADLIAAPNSWSLDFSLLKLSVNPPPEYNVYFAGWNRSTAPATKTVTIHHPSGDIKKISFDYDPPVTGDYGSGTVKNSHWNIIEWDLGTTEGGSSGSPLFDENHRIVGDLTGGDASCSYNYNDYYAKFDMSWDYYADPNQQLKAWLDPDNTGVMAIDGFEADTIDIQITKVNIPADTFCLTNNIVSPEIEVLNSGLNTITSFRVNYAVNSGNIQYYDWTGNLTPGNSVLIQLPDVWIPSGSGTFKAYTSAPNNTTDENNYNDTLVKNFQADTVFTTATIEGDKYVCGEELYGKYYISNSGKYNWNVTNGVIDTILAPNDIIVKWNSWGNRQIDLTLSNTCDTIEETMEVIPVEQGITLNINTQNHPVSWNISFGYDDIIFSGDIPANSGNVTLPMCLISGCYSLYLYEANGCTDCSFSVTDKNNNVLVSGTFSETPKTASFCVEDQENAIYNIYPNPAKDKITIEANFIEAYNNASFSIYTLNGALKIPENELTESTTIDISELRNGYYLIKIRSDHGEFTKSFIKQ